MPPITVTLEPRLRWEERKLPSRLAQEPSRGAWVLENGCVWPPGNGLGADFLHKIFHWLEREFPFPDRVNNLWVDVNAGNEANIRLYQHAVLPLQHGRTFLEVQHGRGRGRGKAREEGGRERSFVYLRGAKAKGRGGTARGKEARQKHAKVSQKTRAAPAAAAAAKRGQAGTKAPAGQKNKRKRDGVWARA